MTDEALGSHTPGPWRVLDPIHGVGVQMGRAGGFLIEGPQAAANARLIAAAPDLLAALRICRAVIGSGSRYARLRVEPEAIAQAEAALSKAEGSEVRVMEKIL